MFLLDFFKKKDFKKVLSLDGGGVRALAAVIFLKQLGLRPNDIILEIQRIPVLEIDRLFSELNSDSLNEILLEVQRDTKLRVIRITQ